MSKLKTKTCKFKISGMHCVSCAMNIDGAMEDLPGVRAAKTNYAKSETVVECDEGVEQGVMIEEIKKLGYQVNVD